MPVSSRCPEGDRDSARAEEGRACLGTCCTRRAPALCSGVPPAGWGLGTDSTGLYAERRPQKPQWAQQSAGQHLGTQPWGHSRCCHCPHAPEATRGARLVIAVPALPG